jgi:hypothetical protein
VPSSNNQVIRLCINYFSGGRYAFNEGAGRIDDVRRLLSGVVTEQLQGVLVTGLVLIAIGVVLLKIFSRSNSV